MASLDNPTTFAAFEQRYFALQAQTPRDPAGVLQGLDDLLKEVRSAQHFPILEARILCALGGCTFFMQDLAQTLHYNEEALSILQRHPEPNVEGSVRNGLGIAKQRLGRNDEALEEFLISLQLAENLGLSERRAQTLINVGACHHHLGNHEQALSVQLEALSYSQSLNYQPAITYSQLNLVAVHTSLGRYPEALALEHDTLSRLQNLGDQGAQMELCRDLSAAALGSGQPQTAAAHAQQGLTLTAPGQQQVRGELMLALARAQRTLNQDEQAETHLLAAEDIASSGGLLKLAAQVHQEFSSLFEARGEYRRALEHGRKQQAAERQVSALLFESRASSLKAHSQMRALQRETELERQRNTALAEKNQELLLTQERLRHQATHDSLTGVCNREHFTTCVQDALDTLVGGEHAALLFIDLDQFKSVNDLFTHAAGDEVLRQVAARLGAAIQAPDVVGRVGGDEFNVLLYRVPSREAALRRARALLDTLREPYHWQGRAVEVTASIGCAVAPDDGTDAGTLQGRADLAMFNVKHALRNNVLMYSPEIQVEHERRLTLEHELRGALGRGELHLYYQGRFSVTDQTLVGFEALIRWFHPHYGVIAPKTFIPLAENTGLILSIGPWVLRQACLQAAAWDFARRGMSISVNVSPLQFEQGGFVQTVRDVLRETNLPGACLVLELTETLVLRNMAQAQDHIRQIQELGVRVAIDDFGTGFSSLSVLHDLPFNDLKIDQSFIHRIQDNRAPPLTSGILMDGMVSLAHDLNMAVTAEGLENQQQLLYLRDLNCDFAQGYLLGEPQAAEDAGKLLTAG